MPRPLPRAWARLLAEVATGVWRLRRRLDSAGGEPPSELRRALRDVEALWDALAQARLQILDHTGAAYDATQSLTVVAFQPTPALDRERVIETLRPTVYFEKEWIQMGEVIVGTPEPGSGPADEPGGSPAEGDPIRWGG